MRQLVFDDAPIIFAHYETINYLTRKEIMGSTVNPTLELRMANVWRNRRRVRAAALRSPIPPDDRDPPVAGDAHVVAGRDAAARLGQDEHRAGPAIELVGDDRAEHQDLVGLLD